MNAKSLIKNAVASPIGWPLVVRLLRAPGVTVLMYHRICASATPFEGCEVELFRKQMRWLKQNCRPIGPDEVKRCANDTTHGRPSVLVTFDDGYRDYFDNAYPILKELEIPAVVFLATSFMDNGGMIWTDEVTWAVTHATAGQFALPWAEETIFDFAVPHERERFRDQAKLYLKAVPDAERKGQLSRLIECLGISPEQLHIDRQMLSWDEVRASLDLTTYGGHSHTHPIMSQLDEASLEAEIKTCRDRIQEETGLAPKYFAYPNGRLQDFNDTTKQLLKRHGFELAFSTVLGSNDSSMDPLAIKRLHNGNSTGDLACLIAGIARA
jgi:peptidoglycan/xylan/chitin deacetylase (PgdA/CDA1 family)